MRPRARIQHRADALAQAVFPVIDALQSAAHPAVGARRARSRCPAAAAALQHGQAISAWPACLGARGGKCGQAIPRACAPPVQRRRRRGGAQVGHEIRDGGRRFSCPTAETTGTEQAAMARATASSLKVHKSSSDPPPRPTMTTSGHWDWLEELDCRGTPLPPSPRPARAREEADVQSREAGVKRI